MSSAHFDPLTTPESESRRSSASGMATPTHTISSTNTMDNSCSCPIQSTELADTPPFPGQTFAIRERNTGRYITLAEGNLLVLENVGNRGGWHWVCVENNGWLGFRNPVSSTHIGHDTKHNYWAEYKHHLSHESFCARKHPQGGYILLSRQGEALWKMAINECGRLVETKEDGTLWDFIRVSA